MPGALAPSVHQLKISLQGAAPPLWRRIQIPSGASLGFLHDVIQVAFGWDGYHLHRFQDGRGREWGEPPVQGGDGYMAAMFADEEEAGLGKVLRAEGAVLEYVYDFGDSWLHRIEAEKIMPLDPDVTYPRCTGGRRAAPPAEDIGGIWGLEEVVYLVTHPEADPPEHFEDLVSHLREKGYDPGAFDPAELTVRLAGLTVRTAAKATRTRNGTRRRIQRLTNEDLQFCTCGRCQVGDPVRSVDGGYLTEEVPGDAEVFPVITLPPLAELAAHARRVPLIDDALRLAEWCAPGRQVTAKAVLKPSVARQAVEELRLWQRDDQFADPRTRADALAGLRSAADLAVLDAPWRFAFGNGLIAIRFSHAVPGPDLPDPDNADQLLSCWQETFEEELGALHDMGGRILPGMLSMLSEQFDSVVFPVLKLLYRLPDKEWLDTAGLMSSLGADAGESGTPIGGVFIIESTARLMKILSDFGAADVDGGTTQWRSDHAAAITLFTDSSLAKPDYRMRLTPLGRYGIRNILASEGHTTRAAGDLAAADAATLLDALPDYDPAGFDAELHGWLAGRDEASAVAQLLEAVSGTDPDLARRRVAAITVLTKVKPDDARAILRGTAANGSDGRRYVAAGVLASLGEEPPLYRETTQQWLLIDLLTALHAGDLRGNLTHDLMEAIRSHADDLWRSGHPAATDTIEATAAAIRDTDKTLAKQLRRSAHKARSRR
jgi:Plasmid pRiA4b ORF-3-like protein